LTTLGLLALLFTLAAGSRAAGEEQEHPSPAPGEHAHWGYGAEDGPAAWPTLRPEWRLCGSGRSQSPIDLVTTGTGEGAFTLDYHPASLRIARNGYVAEVLNNGHTIQVDVEEESELRTAGRRYQLLQYHFHAPSEHAVAGRRFPMEMHLVHRSDEGELAVVGVLIEEGAKNPAAREIWENLPAKEGGQAYYENVEIDPSDLIPPQHRWYHYRGSLTTPPCSEGVEWFVIADPASLSKEQIRNFTTLYSGNARPLQQGNARQITLERFD
jgi:carbonic anhydrase